jgi:hypothetical protein
MADLVNPRIIVFKGFLFLSLGLLAGGILLARHPNLATAALLCISVWAFCRFYYFVFYVIQHYLDSEYRFSGLFAFLRYAIEQLFMKPPKQ